VAAVIELGTDTFTTLAGAKFLDATPAVGDLVVIVIANSAATAGTAPTDNNADGLGTYTLAETCVNKSSVDYASVYIRNALIGSATSTRFTNNNASNNGGGLCVLKVTGMTKTGATAKRQSAKQDNMSAGTPAPVLSSAALTTNPVVGVVLNGTSPATMLSRSAGGAWSEWTDAGYSTPTTGVHVMASDSTETGATITWGSASSTGFGAVVVELDASSTTQSNAPRARILQMLRNA
jgi:predicted outer membrane repeat protein